MLPRRRKSHKKASRSKGSQKNGDSESKAPEEHDPDDPMFDTTTREFMGTFTGMLTVIGVNMEPHEASHKPQQECVI